jgi:cell filamentation protein
MPASAEESARWYSYFYEGSHVLRNKLGIRDGDRLEEAERFLCDRRYAQIMEGRIRIPRTYDLEHVKAIHAALFQDVYPFAGQLRTVVVGKKITETEPTRVFLSPGRACEVWMGAVGETIRDRDWSSLDRAEAVKPCGLVHERELRALLPGGLRAHRKVVP